MGKKKTPSFTKMVCEALTTVDDEKGMNSKMILNFIKEKYSVEGDDKTNLNLIHKELERGKTSAKYIQIQGKNIQHGHFSFNLSYVPPNEPQSDQLPDYLNPPEAPKEPIAPIEMAKKEKKTKTLAEYIKDLPGSNIRRRLALTYLQKEFLDSTSQHQEAVELDVIPKFVGRVLPCNLEFTDFALGCLLLLCEQDPKNCKLALNAEIGMKLFELLNGDIFSTTDPSMTLIASKASSLIKTIIDYMEHNKLDFEDLDLLFFSLSIWRLVENLDEFGFQKLAMTLKYMWPFGTKASYKLFFDGNRNLTDKMHETLLRSEGEKSIFLSTMFIQTLPFEIPTMLQNGLANKLFKLLETTENKDYLKMALLCLTSMANLFKEDFRSKCDGKNVRSLYSLLRSDDHNVYFYTSFLFKMFISKFEHEKDISSTVSLIFPVFEQYAEVYYKLFQESAYPSETGYKYALYKTGYSVEMLKQLPDVEYAKCDICKM